MRRLTPTLAALLAWAALAVPTARAQPPATPPRPGPAPAATRPPGPTPPGAPAPAAGPAPSAAPAPRPPAPVAPPLPPRSPPLPPVSSAPPLPYPVPPLPPAYATFAPDLDLGTTPALDLPPDTVELAERLQRTEDLVLNRQPSVHVGRVHRLRLLRPPGATAPATSRTSATRLTPEYAGRYGWVFLGDILAPTVNTRGEAADLGNAPGVDRFDSVHSRGAPGFILNEANLALRSALTDNALATASVNFVPRTGNDFAPGRLLRPGPGPAGVAAHRLAADVDLRRQDRLGAGDRVPRAQGQPPLRHHPLADRPLHGRHRPGAQGAHQVRRPTTCWCWRRPHQRLERHRAVPLLQRDRQQRRQDPQRPAVPALPLRFESSSGVSGAEGAQDRALDSEEALWFVGLDLLAELGPLELKGQWLKGKAPG